MNTKKYIYKKGGHPLAEVHDPNFSLQDED
jgi:hypothetical protein